MNDKLKLLQMIDKSAEERAKGPRSAETHRQSTDNVNKCAAFCLNETECRRVMLLTYFGESFPRERCNSTCDNCQQPQRDLQEVITSVQYIFFKCQKILLTACFIVTG